MKWAEHYNSMDETEARAALADLCAQRFGKTWRGAFAEHLGFSRPQTVSDWMHQTRPPTWALVLMREWQESERQRYLVESLKNFRSVLDAL